MTKGLPIRVMTVFVAFWVAIAPAMFAVPATAMTSQMSASANGMSGDCDCCPNPGMDQNHCQLVCLNAMAFAITPNHGDVATAHSVDAVWLGGRLALDGHSAPPEPPPPKSVFSR